MGYAKGYERIERAWAPTCDFGRAGHACPPRPKGTWAAFACFYSRLHAFAYFCLRLRAFACFCLPLPAFAGFCLLLLPFACVYLRLLALTCRCSALENLDIRVGGLFLFEKTLTSVREGCFFLPSCVFWGAGPQRHQNLDIRAGGSFFLKKTLTSVREGRFCLPKTPPKMLPKSS